MPNTITTPLMSLIVPVNLVDASPDWGARIQAAFVAVDGHTHAPGSGAQVPSAGININADLDFGGFNLTGLRTARLNSQGAPLSLGSDVDCLYCVNGELFYNDSFARQVQLTKVGAVNTAPQAFSVKVVVTSYTILSTDLFQLFYAASGSSVTAIALPSAATVAAGRAYYFVDRDQNQAINPTTITPNGGDTINGVNAAIALTRNASLTIMVSDGVSKWTANTVAAQPSALSSTLALTNVNVTPTAAQLASKTLVFTGTLTGDVVIIFPNAPGEFTCDFSAVVMGAFHIAVRSGSTTSANMAAANVGSTQTLNQLSYVLAYGGNTIRLKA